MNWKTYEMMKFAKEVCGEGFTVHTDQAYGDHDTEHVLVDRDGNDADCIDFCGFRTDSTFCTLEDTGNCHVEMMELRTWGSHSDGGIKSSDEKLAIAAVKLQTRLMNSGWNVCGKMDVYF